MVSRSTVENARGNPAALERLYREALAAGDESSFGEAVALGAAERPDDLLFAAWVLRLEPGSPAHSGPAQAPTLAPRPVRYWVIAIATSLVLGLLYAVFAGDRPPVPVPPAANPLFWIGWAPLTALGILAVLAAAHRPDGRLGRHGIPALVVLALAAYSAWIGWSRTDDIAVLVALHLPLVAWSGVGAALSLGRPERVRHHYAFLAKSVETVVTGGIYFGGGALLLGLTAGIFAALGIRLPQQGLHTAAAWGIGCIPILALTSVYDPSTRPADQNWTTGLARILRILSRLLLPLALGILAVYIFWFIPLHFWQPFQERGVLIVYNATIMAVLVLLTTTVMGPQEDGSRAPQTALRWAVLALAGLALLLNLYALAATIGRTAEFGLTPNRYAVLGWNVVTLLTLATALIRVVRARVDQWVVALQTSIARVSILAVAWALWVLVALPLSFD